MDHLFNSLDSAYKTPRGAVRAGEPLRLALTIPEHYGFVEDGRQLSEAEVHKLIRVFKTREPQLAGFNVEYGMLTQEAIDLFTKENVPLSCWIVDDERAICQLLRANITYITTNHVKYAIAQREKLL